MDRRRKCNCERTDDDDSLKILPISSAAAYHSWAKTNLDGRACKHIYSSSFLHYSPVFCNNTTIRSVNHINVLCISWYCLRKSLQSEMKSVMWFHLWFCLKLWAVILSVTQQQLLHIDHANLNYGEDSLSTLLQKRSWATWQRIHKTTFSQNA